MGISREVEYKKCLEEIFIWYDYYAQKLFEDVLDEINDYKYPAFKVYQILKDVILFKKLYYDKEIKSVYEYLEYGCYQKEDIEFFEKKVLEEGESSNTRLKRNDLCSCVERIFEVYCERTIDFFDSVLNDNEEDPHFSPNIVYACLVCLIKFKKLHYKEYVDSVEVYLINKGYCDKDIERFHEKKELEKKLYPKKFD